MLFHFKLQNIGHPSVKEVNVQLARWRISQKTSFFILCFCSNISCCNLYIRYSYGCLGYRFWMVSNCRCYRLPQATLPLIQNLHRFPFYKSSNTSDDLLRFSFQHHKETLKSPSIGLSFITSWNSFVRLSYKCGDY